MAKRSKFKKGEKAYAIVHDTDAHIFFKGIVEIEEAYPPIDKSHDWAYEAVGLVFNILERELFKQTRLFKAMYGE